ncbi:MAG: restriction endonuclease [Symploca sp. SIO2C1]|nr:restriction endonuclease [Symploca sp. SIO2C1]
MMESRVTRKCHARFGERNEETHQPQGWKVRFVPTPFSPLLANIALHGMENRIKQAFPGKDVRKDGKYAGKISPAHLIRYADDFVILHEDITVVQRCTEIICEWLKGMSLELKPSKTRLAHTLEKYEGNTPGFDFLGFNIRQFPVSKYESGKNNGKLLGFKTIITPSREKQKIHYEKVAKTIYAHRSAPQKALIGNLNPIIRGWANYYSTVVSKETFGKQDYLMFQKLKAWAKRRHPKKSVQWIINKYWKSIDGNNWVFANTERVNNLTRLRTHSETPVVRHVKVKGESSPYDGNLVYWSTRMGKHPEISKKESTLLKRQKGKCNHCGLTFRDGDIWEIDHIVPRSRKGKDEYSNLQLLHKHCHHAKTTEDGSVGGSIDNRPSH